MSETDIILAVATVGIIGGVFGYLKYAGSRLDSKFANAKLSEVVSKPVPEEPRASTLPIKPVIPSKPSGPLERAINRAVGEYFVLPEGALLSEMVSVAHGPDLMVPSMNNRIFRAKPHVYNEAFHGLHNAGTIKMRSPAPGDLVIAEPLAAVRILGDWPRASVRQRARRLKKAHALIDRSKTSG